MKKRVLKVGIKREKGWLYFLDKKGDVSRSKMARGGGNHKPKKPEKIAKLGIKREEGYLYYIDKQGDIFKATMLRRKAKR